MTIRGINGKPLGASFTNYELWMEHFRQRALARSLPDVIGANIIQERAKQLAEKGPPDNWRAMDGILKARKARDVEIPESVAKALKGLVGFMLTRFVGAQWRAVAIAVAGLAVASAALDVTGPGLDQALNTVAIILASLFGFDLAVARDKQAKRDGK